MSTNTPKIFVLQLGALLSLYVTISFLLTLLFSVINIHFPDALQYGWEYDSAASSVRVGIATVLVFFPVFLLLSIISNKNRKSPKEEYSGLIKWFLYLSLLVAGGILLGDLVFLLVSFLEGELTIRFLLKVLAVFLVVGSAFAYYLLDIAEVWQKYPKVLQGVVLGSVLAILGTLVLGFYSIVGPSVARELGLDAKVISDLQEISNRIDRHVSDSGNLPDTLDELYIRSVDIPTAPEDRSAYEYIPKEELNYELCAEFLHATEPGIDNRIIVNVPNYNDIDWTHDAGRWCFSLSATERKLLD